MIAFQSQMTPQKRATWYAVCNKLLLLNLFLRPPLEISSDGFLRYAADALGVLFSLVVIFQELVLVEARTRRAQLQRAAWIVLAVAGMVFCIYDFIVY